MDFLRSGYASTMRLFRDSVQETPIIWYRARPGAQVFPFPHVFGSRNWDADHAVAQSGPGETKGSTNETHTNSVNTNGYLGQDFVGDPDWFLNGAPSSAAGTAPTDANGFCQKCFPGGGGGQGCFSDGFSDGFEL